MQNEAAAAGISELMEKVALFALDEGMDKVQEAGGEKFGPFLVVADKDHKFTQSSLPGGSPQEAYESARGTVQNDDDIEAYALCYDGYAVVNKSQVDGVICEFAERGDPIAYAACRLYCGEGESFEGEEEPTFLGECPTLFPTIEDEA